MDIIGRESEIKELQSYLDSGKAEFIAVYGRRRVGKTFLIDTCLGGTAAFMTSGVIDGKKGEQMSSFAASLKQYGGIETPVPQNWMEAFELLRIILERRTGERNSRVIFIDELPCFDTNASKFVMALGHFWNSYASKQSDVKLIVCGSATSWMVKNIIDNHGGLHNRITHEMHIRPFTLRQTEEYLTAAGFNWDRLLVAQCYMTFGGIPYYLSLLKPQESLAQNIDRLFFNPDGEMKREFNRLFSSLFKSPQKYIKVIELLAVTKKGLTRTQLAEKLGKESGGGLTEVLRNLQYCDFIRLYNVKENKIKEKNGIYQLIDFFTIFHTMFGSKKTTDPHYWSNMLMTSTVNAWLGLSFERLAMTHIENVKHALGIDRIHTEYYSWRSKESSKGAQIDIVIERADKNSNICEVKYSEDEYIITKDNNESMKRKIADFKAETRTRGGIIPTYITTYGLKSNTYSSNVLAQVTLTDLFN